MIPATIEERNEALLMAVLEMESTLAPDQYGEVTCCAGPPVCYIDPDKTAAAGNAGCPHCIRIVVEKKMAQA